MEPLCQSRHIKLRRYEVSLRRSMDCFNKVLQQSPFNIMLQNPISYQFRHWQLKQKNSFVISLSKRSSLNSFQTISQSRKISQKTPQNLVKDPQKIRDKKSFKRENSEKSREGTFASPYISLIVRSKGINKDQRARTVSPGRKEQENKKLAQKKTFGVAHRQNKSFDNEICPWDIVQ
ncbi:hypothetical protein SteCoe_28449 [Stentor coeruleus]|uniref:Uncharacterized protein n=1 Tax=Stentor coeruleus TaxID=5963 RepID=A0A1R2B848_9CILI|nr:hypothetical protein SteCoe_28449 [Stentor coeruleus]